MNSFHGIGRIANDLELRQTNSGKDVTNVRLAINRPGEDKDADFFDVVVWNGSAKALVQYMGKGDEIAVEGYLRVRSWEQDDGTKRSRVEIMASRVTFLRKKGGGNGEAKPVEASAPAPGDDDIPF